MNQKYKPWIFGFVLIILIVIAFIILWWLGKKPDPDNSNPPSTSKPNQLDNEEETEEELEESEEPIEEILIKSKDELIESETKKLEPPKEISSKSEDQLPLTFSERLKVYQPTIDLNTPKEYRGGRDSKFEKLCHKVIKDMFPRTKFYKTRPQWFKNPESNRPLELDIYTHHLEGKDIRLAVECQGRQHREYTPYYHRGGEHEFIEQLRKDQLKLVMCKDLDIILIVIWDEKNTYKKIWNDIIEHLLMYDICPNNLDFI